MLAVIKTGGKQYTVKEGSLLDVELLGIDEGVQEYTFEEVLFVSSDAGKVTIGKPTVSGAKVVAEVIGETRGDKILVFKKKRRKDYRKRQGHRQDYVRVKIKEISL